MQDRYKYTSLIIGNMGDLGFEPSSQVILYKRAYHLNHCILLLVEYTIINILETSHMPELKKTKSAKFELANGKKTHGHLLR